ncbi:MAG TPA: Holliday junction DNA helicase RuvB C-terminal domain-containing protein [Chloroflexota bacterium]|nr:Holliday junction DNA helicase RuvB C-terminal domain-containing protein [Chloroflexota bacterium]
MPEERLSEVNAASPNVIERVIGQGQVLAAIKVALEACWNDGTRFPHGLFVGPPGLGKSLVAQLVAKEMGSTLRETLAQTLTNAADLNALLLEAGDRDVVFLDECDELDPSLQVLLYRTIAEGKLFVPRNGAARVPPAIPLANFTLLLACNNEFKLARPLVERLKLLCRFEYYTDAEVAQIVRDRAHALRWEVEDSVFPAIAKLARGVPRLGLRLLESAYRTARSENDSMVTARHFRKTCALEGLDELGLDRTQQRYLAILHEAQGSPVRLGVIADRLGLPPRTISSVIEPFLIREDLIRRQDSGRELSPKGWDHMTHQTATRASSGV